MLNELIQIELMTWIKGLGIVLGFILVSLSISIIAEVATEKGNNDDDYTC